MGSEKAGRVTPWRSASRPAARDAALPVSGGVITIGGAGRSSAGMTPPPTTARQVSTAPVSTASRVVRLGG
ncbi:hypothetical protein [Nonomuraea fuscirosea]|uniref:hypothetical protein n=1 Tax=Nonomuraea fuscirosea TaxID=1291556 RepID=UPI0033CBCD82